MMKKIQLAATLAKDYSLYQVRLIWWPPEKGGKGLLELIYLIWNKVKGSINCRPWGKTGFLSLNLKIIGEGSIGASKVCGSESIVKENRIRPRN